MTGDIFWDGRWWDGAGIIWAILGMLGSGIFWILLFAVIIKLVKSRPVTISSPPSAIRILEERYARGDISQEEFMERRAVLTDRARYPSSSPPTSPPPTI